MIDNKPFAMFSHAAAHVDSNTLKMFGCRIRRIAVIATLFAALSTCATSDALSKVPSADSLCGDVKAEHFKTDAAKLVFGVDVENVMARLKSAASRGDQKADEARALVDAVEKVRETLKDEIRNNMKSQRPGLALIQLEKLVKTWPSERAHFSKVLQTLSASRAVKAVVRLRRALEGAATTMPGNASNAKKQDAAKRAAISAAERFAESKFPGVAKEIAELLASSEVHGSLVEEGTSHESGAKANKSAQTAITIIGDADFTERTRNALSLIEKDAPEFYKMVTTYVGIIQSAEKSGMRAYANPPTFEVGLRTSRSPVSWYASSIVHDAYHSKLYNDYRKKNNGPVPSEIWTGRKAEDACLSVQEDFLKTIHAPEHQIRHVQNGKHVDYFSNYKNRDW